MAKPEMRVNIPYFPNQLEAAFASGNESLVDWADRALEGAGRLYPKQAPDIYKVLTGSPVETSRLAVARHIGALAGVNPENAANLWLLLLRDTNKEVAMSAYYSFSDYCYEVEHGHEPEAGILPLSRVLEAQYSEDKPSKAI